jgi:CSLREA domain-containing protein
VAGLLLALPAGAGAATITVNTTVDELGAGPRCSLREAVWASNNDSGAQAPGCRAGAGADTIRLPAGNFRLNRQATPPAVTAEDAGIYGDLDIIDPVTIVHVGLRPSVVSTTIFGERPFHVLAGGTGARLERLVIDGGSVGAGVGGGILNQGVLRVEASTILNGSASSGGGLANTAGSAVLRNSTVFGNFADQDGGGIWVGGGTVSLRSVTVSGNRTSSGDGAGAFVFSAGPPSQLLLADTMVAGNLDTGTEAHDCARIGGAITSLGQNLIANTNGCGYQRRAGDITNRSARIIELDDFGGPTPTVNLRRSSPAINAARGCPRTDQRGVPRGRGRCTIGSWELAVCRGVVINSVGTNGPELLIGTSRADGFLALGGADTVRGLGGNDGLCGGGGPDRLEGGGANDRLDGGPNRDTCLPGGGRNRLFSCELRGRIW